jgi:hypothetical protein
MPLLAQSCNGPAFQLTRKVTARFIDDEDVQPDDDDPENEEDDEEEPEDEEGDD